MCLPQMIVFKHVSVCLSQVTVSISSVPGVRAMRPVG